MPARRRRRRARGGASAADDAGTAPSSAAALATALSFNDFYAERRDQLARALSLYFGNEDLGAEAADEAFARAYERWPAVSQHPNPYGWVYVVGMNRARSVLRRRVVARDKQPLLAADAEHARSADAVDLDTKAAVARLRPAWRAVVIARFYMGWSVSETAEALDVKTGTVKSRLSRALDQLRADLAGAGPADTGPADAGPTP